MAYNHALINMYPNRKLAWDAFLLIFIIESLGGGVESIGRKEVHKKNQS